MELTNFLKIMNESLGNYIEVNDDTKRKNALLKLQDILGWFMLEEDEPYLVLDGKADFAGKVYRGSEPLPKDVAAAVLNRFDTFTFADWLDEKELTDEALENLASKFAEFGITIDPYNAGRDIANVLKEILENIKSAPKKRSIRYCEIIDGKVKIGNEYITLPAKLIIPDDIDAQEEPYINALLEVYAQDSNTPITSISDLDNLNLQYKEHIKVQRENFYNAESVLHQIRDAGIFTDGVNEFDVLKNETLDSISDTVIEQYKNGFARVKQVLHVVASVNFTKSFLAKPGNGLIGPSEKRGIVHMLVNDGKVKWIYEYDTDI